MFGTFVGIICAAWLLMLIFIYFWDEYEKLMLVRTYDPSEHQDIINNDKDIK